MRAPAGCEAHRSQAGTREEGVRAFKFGSILGYELPWNSLEFTNNSYFRLEQKHIDKKLAALAEYKSQSFRSYSTEELFVGLSRIRGKQAGAEFAEAFELIKWVF